MTHFRSGSLKSMSSTRTKHDGHVDGNLNFIALYVYVIHIDLFTAKRHYSLCRRHGWSRTFTVAPEDIHTLDYAALEDILELNTLKLRPVGLRVFIEHPPDSNQWAKIRPWKQDTSLVSLLLNDFFERRRRDGIVLRIDVRDGHERPVTDAGAVNGFASAVGSFIAGSMRSEREREQVDKAWWRLGSGSSRDRLLSASTSTNATRRRGVTEGETEDERGPLPRLKKVCTMRVSRGSLAVAFPPSPITHHATCNTFLSFAACLLSPYLPISLSLISIFRLKHNRHTDYKNDGRSWGIVRTAFILFLPCPFPKIAATNSPRTRTTALHL